MRANLGLVVFAIALVAAALYGNYDAIDPSAIQDTAALPTPRIDGNVIGQTLRSRYPSLSAIQVRFTFPIEPSAPPGGRITLHLRASPSAEGDLAAAPIPLDQIQNNDFSRFSFPPIANSLDQNYYFFFDITPGAGPFMLWSSGEDAYSDGSLYVNNSPTPRDLSFRAYYAPDLGMLARSLDDTLARYGASAIILACFFLLLFYAVLRAAPILYQLSGMLALLAAIVVALLQIRDLPAPLWVDSLSHAQYVQFILSNARLPAESFYHLGFHVLTAVISRLFDLSIPKALLLTGQSSWVLVGIAMFSFGRRISNSALSGLVSAACVWFLSPTPLYFITWGRYPLVLGSALLPLALQCAIDLIQQRNARTLILAALTFGALAFAQIRLVAFYGVFLAIYAAVVTRREQTSERSPITTLRAPITTLLILSISFLIIPLLWLGYLFSHGVTPQSIFAQNQTAPSIDLQTALDVLQTHHGIMFFVLAAVSAILGVARRARVTLLMLGWLAGMAAVALTLRAPIFGELVPLSLVPLMAFLPAAILIGDAAQFAFERLQARDRIVPAAAGVALIVIVSFLGARDMINLANPATVLFTRADENAMKWIGANVPPHSKFLVNSFNWVGATYVPSDGGGWIPYFTGNPVEYLGADNGDSQSNLVQWMIARKPNYVYLGTRAGTLSAVELFAHPELFSLVYNDSGINIFRIKTGTGQ